MCWVLHCSLQPGPWSPSLLPALAASPLPGTVTACDSCELSTAALLPTLAVPSPGGCQHIWSTAGAWAWWEGSPGCADGAACGCPPSAAYGLIVRPNDFASYLLAIGICNLLLYFAFYIIMKVGAEPLGRRVGQRQDSPCCQLPPAR